MKRETKQLGLTVNDETCDRTVNSKVCLLQQPQYITKSISYTMKSLLSCSRHPDCLGVLFKFPLASRQTSIRIKLRTLHFSVKLKRYLFTLLIFTTLLFGDNPHFSSYVLFWFWFFRHVEVIKCTRILFPFFLALGKDQTSLSGT